MPLLALSDPALTRLPSRDNIKRRIRKLRQGKDISQTPNDPNFPALPVQLTKTIRHDQFLRCDIGPGDEQISILQSTQDILVDGTLKVVPEIFYQLYIIYSIYRHHIVPVVFALLCRNDAEAYTRLINEIHKSAPPWLPQSIVLDFKQACIKTYETSFPNVKLSGCYCHLRQNVYRKIQVSNLIIMN